MSEKTIFDKIIEFVFEWEGGITDDANDPGGLTNFGITKRDYPALDIRNLLKSEAKKIYYEDYYIRFKINQMPEKLQIVMLDSTVNTGGTQTAKFLQRALGVVVDGLIGPITLKKLAVSDPLKVGKSILEQRKNFYLDLSISRPQFKKFVKGWLNRVQANEEEFLKQFKGVV